MPRAVRDNVGINLEGVPPTKFGRRKNVKNLNRFLTTFDFDRKYLCMEMIDITKIEKLRYQLQTLPHWTKKLVNFGPQTKK